MIQADYPTGNSGAGRMAAGNHGGVLNENTFFCLIFQELYYSEESNLNTIFVYSALTSDILIWSPK